MSEKINERPIYDGQSYYWNEATEPISTAPGPNTEVDCLRRLQMELAYKPYYIWDDLCVFMDECSLNPHEKYDKNLHEAKLLKTVLSILQALSNNIDLYMSHNMDFGSRGEAYSNLRKRIEDIKKRIRDIEEEKNENKSDIFFLYCDR